MTKRERTLFPPREPMWKAKDLIMALGGVGGITERLMELGLFPPGADTIQGWATRNRIPGPWSPAVFALALREKVIDTPLDALIPDTPMKAFHPVRKRSGKTRRAA